MRRALIMSMFVATAGLLLMPQVSEANHACTSYTIKAPIVATQSGTTCSPVSLPPSFTNPVTAGNCLGLPPAGVLVCASGSLHLP